MRLISLKLTALALAGALAASSGAQAGGYFDKDYPGSHKSQNLDAYCDRNPYDDACDDDDDDRQYYHKKKYHKKNAYHGRCRALIRAAGKRNLVTLFARNSARFAWRREVRAVHGSQYANWRNARHPHITCTRRGALKECVARATPCRY